VQGINEFCEFTGKEISSDVARTLGSNLSSDGYEGHENRSDILKFGCLHPVACIRSGSEVSV
jgi:hypothetical protein